MNKQEQTVGFHEVTKDINDECLPDTCFYCGQHGKWKLQNIDRDIWACDKHRFLVTVLLQSQLK